MKGRVQQGASQTAHILVQIDGLPPIYAVKIGPFKKEIRTSQAPDDTTHSVGRSKADAPSMTTMLHHRSEHAAMEGWFTQCERGQAGYKREGTISYLQADGVTFVASYQLVGIWLTARELPEHDEQSDDQAMVTWTLSVDDYITLG